VKFGATPCRLRRPAPELGGDTDDVLRELGLGDQIARLRSARVV